MNDDRFSFEDLEIWQEAVEFANQCLEITERISNQKKHYRIIEQMEAASTSIMLNIAEGKGRFSKKEFVQYLYISRGSLFETVALLILFNKRQWIEEGEFKRLKNNASRLGKRISSLINSIKNS